MSWSRLIDTPLGQAARAVYDSDPARHYHNWDHIERLYWHATNTFDLAYDAALDHAILAHDVIYDALPNKEIRSADWLRTQMGDDASVAVAHILKTIDHIPSDDNRMVLLDLADFFYKDKTAANLAKIERESCALYGITSEMFLTANIDFMTGLHDRIEENLDVKTPPQDAAHFRLILNGIKNSRQLARDRLKDLKTSGGL